MNAEVRDPSFLRWSCGESNSRAITVTCTQHGAAGFTNLMVSKHDGTVVLDPTSPARA